MTQGSEHMRRGAARRVCVSEAGNTAALPLLVCIAALIAAAIILGTFATGLAHRSSDPAPSWSGAQGPPGAIGMAHEGQSAPNQTR